MLNFMGHTFGDPATVVALEDVKKDYVRLRHVQWRVPPERQWVLRQPLQRRIAAIGAAAIVSQEQGRRLGEVQLQNADWDGVVAGVAKEERWALERVSGMPFEEFSYRCREAFARYCDAWASALEAHRQLWAEVCALTQVIGFAIHGFDWFWISMSAPSGEMRTEDAAAQLECTRRHVQRLAAQGKIESRRHPDGSWRYKASSVQDYLDGINGRSA